MFLDNAKASEGFGGRGPLAKDIDHFTPEVSIFNKFVTFEV